HVAGGAVAQRLDDVGVVGVHRQDDHARRRRAIAHLARHLEAVEAGHHEVEHQHVGLELEHPGQDLQPVGGLADDLEVVFAREQDLEAVDDDLVIVGEEDSGLHALAPILAAAGLDGKGSSAVSRVPSPFDSMSMVPPRAAARSRMPLRPLDWPAARAAATSKPLPPSAICTESAAPSRHTRTFTDGTAAWRATLVSASCTMRKAAVSTMGDMRPSRPVCANSTFTLVCLL